MKNKRSKFISSFLITVLNLLIIKSNFSKYNRNQSNLINKFLPSIKNLFKNNNPKTIQIPKHSLRTVKQSAKMRSMMNLLISQIKKLTNQLLKTRKPMKPISLLRKTTSGKFLNLSNDKNQKKSFQLFRVMKSSNKKASCNQRMMRKVKSLKKRKRRRMRKNLNTMVKKKQLSMLLNQRNNLAKLLVQFKDSNRGK